MSTAIPTIYVHALGGAFWLDDGELMGCPGNADGTMAWEEGEPLDMMDLFGDDRDAIHAIHAALVTLTRS